MEKVKNHPYNSLKYPFGCFNSHFKVLTEELKPLDYSIIYFLVIHKLYLFCIHYIYALALIIHSQLSGIHHISTFVGRYQNMV